MPGSPGDLLHNQTFSVADVQPQIDMALGLGTAGRDLNMDGVVNVVDVAIQINAALTLVCSAR
jgi:hypothetical protein